MLKENSKRFKKEVYKKLNIIQILKFSVHNTKNPKTFWDFLCFYLIISSTPVSPQNNRKNQALCPTFFHHW
jgi:hypothetical protein